MEEALPPSYEESEAAHRQASSAPDISKPLLTLVSMRDAELRNALYKYIENKFSYGSRFIEEMILTEIWNDCAFVYTLESMAETRDYGNKIIAYDGWIEEGPEDDSGLPPYHWEVPVQVPTEFADSNVVTEIPHTGYIKQCLRCYGQKEHKCNYCSGQGKQPCGRCGGGGIDDDGSICIRCNRTGKVWCSDCEGRKKLACSLCRGSGKLKHFDQLVVAWKYQKCSEISNVSELPTEIVCTASGKEIYKDQGVTNLPAWICDFLASRQNTSARIMSGVRMIERTPSLPERCRAVPLRIEQCLFVSLECFVQIMHLWRTRYQIEIFIGF
ncbi:protein SSUH2 [Trichonephila inaurata madagascariensis]|uniref:Protein SSUH2 n=1 Tax=Trichonephila inaurata madagascariensis TaxID=2747483 RepID=A0A8X6XND5_9ARAC|nr:protein SSUH2 [Trichonephila inaurata madagascariensis]